MNPSYARIRLPLTEAMSRFGDWIGLPELEPPRRVLALRAVEEACEGGEWRGVAVFVHEANGWTVFDDLSGYLAVFSPYRWARLAQGDELVFAGYNDAVPYGQLFVVRGGEVVRDFLQDLKFPNQNVNSGRLEWEGDVPIDAWSDVAAFYDGDELSDAGAAEGLLWLFQLPERFQRG